MHRSTRRSTMVVALSVCVTLTAAAACSGDDDDTADSVSAEATATAASDTDAESSTDSAAPGSTEPGTTSGGATTAPAATDAPAAEERVVGPGEHHVERRGRARQGWHARVRPGGRHRQRLGAVPRQLRRRAATSRSPSISDSLFAVTDEGETVPLLVESVDHNADYTEWTLHIRDGIEFHDGTPLDGAAVKFNLDANRASPAHGVAR